MSSADAADIQTIPSSSETPKLPGAITINPPTVQPGNASSSAPQINAQNPPNVDGGPASFSTVTSSIANLVQAKTAELSADQNALKANTAVDQSVFQAVAGYQKATMDSYANIQKANRLPGGPSGGLARILGIFDSDYNVNYQKTNIELNTLASQAVSASGAAIKEQNNQLPALAAKTSAAAQTVWEAQKDANDLLLKKGQLDVDQNRAAIEAARLRIEMSDENRKAIDFRIKGMTTEQIQAELPRAQAGKGPFANLGGLLEDRLQQEQTAEASLGKAQLELQKGNREEYNNNLTDMVSHMPQDLVTQLYQNAQSQGKGFVEFGTGQIDPKTKQPVTVQVPLDIVQNGIVAGQKRQTDVNTALAADYTNKLDIVPKMINQMNIANAFAGVDSRATQIATQLGSIVQNMNPKDPQNVRQTGIMLDNLKKQSDLVVKQVADRASTPEAKAAIIAYGNSGKFDSTGGTAVVTDSIGDPSLTTRSLYKTAFRNFANLVASKANSTYAGGIDYSSQNPSGADTMQIMSAIMGQNKGKQKLASIAAEVLADPKQAKAIAGDMTAAIQTKTVNDTLNGLAQKKDADPVWNEMFQHTEQFLDKNGQISFDMMMNKLEKQDVLSGGKKHYAQTFLTAIRNYGVNAENAAAADPTYTMQDRALEASIFGGNPYQAVAGDLFAKFKLSAQKAHQEMQARIQNDISGKTQRDAVLSADPVFEEYPGPTDNSVFAHTTKKDLYKRTGVNLDNVPSATGVGMTAEQIKQMYGGGIP